MDGRLAVIWQHYGDDVDLEKLHFNFQMSRDLTETTQVRTIHDVITALLASGPAK